MATFTRFQGKGYLAMTGTTGSPVSHVFHFGRVSLVGVELHVTVLAT